MDLIQYVELICGGAVVAYVVFFVMTTGLFNKD